MAVCNTIIAIKSESAFCVLYLLRFVTLFTTQETALIEDLWSHFVTFAVDICVRIVK